MTLPPAPWQLTLTMTMTRRNRKKTKRKAALPFQGVLCPLPEQTWIFLPLLLMPNPFIKALYLWLPGSHKLRSWFVSQALASQFHGYIAWHFSFTYCLQGTKRGKTPFWVTYFSSNTFLLCLFLCRQLSKPHCITSILPACDWQTVH